MKLTADIVIIGGGIIGCSIAYQLRKTGASVAVLEKGELCQEASAAATGLLAPFKVLAKETEYLKMQQASLKLFPDLIAELEAATGIDCGYQVTGTVRLCHEQQRGRIQSWLADFTLAPAKLLDQAQLRDVVPGIADDQMLAVALPEEPQLSPQGFAAAMIAAGRKTGVTFLEDCPVVAWERDGRAMRLRTSDGSIILCQTCILATGAWSGRTGALFGIDIPVKPVHGQSIAVQQPKQRLKSILFGNGIYLAPKGEEIVIGATAEDRGFVKDLSWERVETLLTKASAIYPPIEEAGGMRTWAGLRPGTSDHRPIIGRAPEQEHVLLACGHNGFGFLLSPITAMMMTAMLTEQTTQHLAA